MPSTWIHFFDNTAQRQALLSLLHGAGLDPQPMSGQPQGPGLMVLSAVNGAVLDHIHQASQQAELLVLAVGGARISSADQWALLRAGASDVLVWPQLPRSAADVAARLERAARLRAVLQSPRVAEQLVGSGAAWQSLLRQVVELALFSRSPLLITGETGTGKELIARLVHDLDSRPGKRELVIVDCTTLTPELAGSELFGHERGAFTGAMTARDGAFAQADGGVLFLDEVGELPPTLQAQLLRVVQEGKYKRVGGNAWQRTDFRLLAATHRDLGADVAGGSFRADLYHRIAGACCHAPPLRERREDVLALAQHVQASFEGCGDDALPRPDGFDPAVCQYLLARDYPGNVRELRGLVLRLCQRHAGAGPITIGDVPEDERPHGDAPSQGSLQAQIESAVGLGLGLGLGLKEIGQAATECAIRLAIDQEHGNLHRAALRLGVTDRALQLRRAQQRPAG